MKNRWSDDGASEFIKKYGGKYGEDLAARTYSTRLIGAEKGLVMHGGGNTSVKTTRVNILGDVTNSLYVKGSGMNMVEMEPDDHTGLDLDYLLRLEEVEELSDTAMINEFRTHQFDHTARTPSLETLVHAFLPAKFIDHTHPDQILIVSNLKDADVVIRDALGDEIIVLKYFTPGFKLAKACIKAYEANPDAKGMVLMNHGLITWGETAFESYDMTIRLCSKVERYVKKLEKPITMRYNTALAEARERYLKIAQTIKGIVALRSDDPDHPYTRFILRPMLDKKTLEFVNMEGAREIAITPPITTDYLIRTKTFPLWIDPPDSFDLFKGVLHKALADYELDYEKYLSRNKSGEVVMSDPVPRVIFIPTIGAVCLGANVFETDMVRDITEQTIRVKSSIARIGKFKGLDEKSLFTMEYRGYQRAKIGNNESTLQREVAIVTGSAGAIGSGICKGLLENGCHVALTDLPGDSLDEQYNELYSGYGNRVIKVPMDVTDTESVRKAFEEIVLTFGGVDIVVVNAGIAMVASIAEMSLNRFRQLSKVNIEGTLIVLAEAARHYARQGTGGDCVVVSTKNVFAPGARFGAYSATKSASHQLGRIASLEFASMGVRVNMVAPDAVFSDGERRSGLWNEVGPDRMRARGLDQNQLEEYYKDRNLLKARVTARHVSNAVIFLVTRMTPTTGITIPVDGGLPDATPR